MRMACYLYSRVLRSDLLNQSIFPERVLWKRDHSSLNKLWLADVGVHSTHDEAGDQNPNDGWIRCFVNPMHVVDRGLDVDEPEGDDCVRLNVYTDISGRFSGSLRSKYLRKQYLNDSQWWEQVSVCTTCSMPQKPFVHASADWHSTHPQTCRPACWTLLRSVAESQRESCEMLIRLKTECTLCRTYDLRRKSYVRMYVWITPVSYGRNPNIHLEISRAG